MRWSSHPPPKAETVLIILYIFTLFYVDWKVVVKCTKLVRFFVCNFLQKKKEVIIAHAAPLNRGLWWQNSHSLAWEVVSGRLWGHMKAVTYFSCKDLSLKNKVRLTLLEPHKAATWYACCSELVYGGDALLFVKTCLSVRKDYRLKFIPCSV